MTKEWFAEHAERGRRGQWRLEELPWDEPVEFCGASEREKTINKLDLIDVAQAMYHFQLGARIRMGDHISRAWSDEEALAECLEWHDIDEQRHLRGLRRLMITLRSAGNAVGMNNNKVDPRRMWRVAQTSPLKLDDERLLMNLLVDEVVAHTLFDAVGRRCHVALARALFQSCADDERRHIDYLLALHRMRGIHGGLLDITRLQAGSVAHIARVQGAFRPYLRAFAGATHDTPEGVATEIFRSVSQVLSGLGPAWDRYPLARLIHTADRSPWLLWVLR
jgi:hypothetical protein